MAPRIVWRVDTCFTSISVWGRNLSERYADAFWAKVSSILGPAIDEIEDAARQPPLGGPAEIGNGPAARARRAGAANPKRERRPTTYPRSPFDPSSLREGQPAMGHLESSDAPAFPFVAIAFGIVGDLKYRRARPVRLSRGRGHDHSPLPRS